MREKDKFIIERSWSRPSKKRLRFQDTAVIRIATYVAFALLLAIGVMAAPEVSSARVAVGISVSFAPPALPVYVQPLCPGPGYIWTPGYWAWDPDIGYYWVPGTWVLAPFPGALWTPGYWGWDDGVYVWYAGYWGLAVGFYGGINYGFGYTGHGYHGGYWDHGTFYYNRSVNNVNVTNITNVYNKTVSGAMTRSRVSYNGGRGGITVRPTAAELAAARERHSAPTDVQLHNERSARLDPRQSAAVNHGKPIVAATQKPGMFSGSGVVRASRAGTPYKAPTSKTVVPGTSARPPHVGNIERGPRTAAPEHAAPPAHVERHATPGQAERSSRATKPKHAAPPAHVERHATPGHVERSPRAAAPEHMTPPAHTERNVAPKHEPAGSVYRHNEGRHIPERSDVARAQGNLHAARQRTEASQQPNNIKREEGRPR